MAVSICDDFRFDEAGLGVLLAICFGVGALLSVTSGRVTEHIGAAGSPPASSALILQRAS